MPFCLIENLAKKFKQAIKEGKIDIDKLMEMSSAERRGFFADIVGTGNAVGVNTLFESKLLLKNQRQGLVNWAKSVTGIKEATRTDLISKIERMDKILSPANEQAFLNDLVNKRLGVEVTLEEAGKINDLATKVKELESLTDKTQADIPLGRAKIELTEYINSISPSKANLLTNIAGVPRSLMASLDLSAPFNQGWGMLSRKQFYTAFRDMFGYLKSAENLKDLQAKIITSPEYPVAKKAGLRLTELGNKLELREESFMSSLLDKVPGIAASQRAYTGFLNKLRMDVFTDLLKKAEIAGEDVGIGSKASQDIASMVNNFTGGARVGRIEGAVPALNATFFSPRKIASTVNMMNPWNYVNPKISKTARLAATRNIIGSTAISLGVIQLASMLGADKVETDPTSTDFGKIRSGNTRLDVTGGNASYAILLSRFISGKMKGSSGISKDLGTGYGETSGADLIAQFLRYKLSPNASLLIDSFVGANAIGEKKTVPQSIIDRFKPMFVNSVVELLRADTSGKFAFTLGALFGGGLNTYSTDTKWEDSTGKELTQFKERVGQEKFDKANVEYNQQVDEWMKAIGVNTKYQELSDEDKQRVVTNKKADIKKKIFQKYGFKYKSASTKKLPKL